MDKEKGYCNAIAGRSIVKSAGFGKYSAEDVNQLTKEILNAASKFGGRKWAYIADPSKMNPILDKSTSEAFAELHKKIEAAGCVAIAFLDGNTSAMKLQSQKNQNNSKAQKLTVEHFKTEMEALAWISSMGIK